MKIGIVGPADRAVAWEKHLRPHRSVSEVIIAGRLQDIGNVDACLLLDESETKLDQLMKAIHLGFHTFLISRLPTDVHRIEKIYHAAEEANVLLQFSHWPTVAPASQWMTSKISKPTFLQVTRDINYTKYMEMKFDLEYYWVDELAYCLKWVGGAVHNVDLKTVELASAVPYALHIFLRFDSGATASICLNASSSENRHHRIAANNTYIVDCNVQAQTVRLGQENDSGRIYFERQIFDASKSAELATTQFIKAIQMKKPTLYNGYDLLKLSAEIQKVRKRIDRF